MGITRDNLDFVSKELNKVLDLEPPIDTDQLISDLVLTEDIKDVFKFNLENKDKLSKKTEKILFVMGLIRSGMEQLIKKDSLPDTPPPEKEPQNPEKVSIDTKEKPKSPKTPKKPNIKKFVIDGFKDGTFKDLKNKEIAEIIRTRFDSKTSPGTIAVYRCNYNKNNK